jgi:hypothetical protein
MPESAYLGVNVYCWSQPEQNFLLVECLEPAVRELCSDFGRTRFWFDRFDARGPHIVTLFTLPPGATGEAEARLRPRLETFLAAHPPSGTVSIEEAEQRHRSCRGAFLSYLDRGPDLVQQGVYTFFEHSPHSYPYLLTRGLRPELEDSVWDLLHELSLWTILQLATDPAGSPVRIAVLWLAAFERILRRLHPHPEGYWRFHASTLLFGLSKRLQEDERQVLASLPSAVGEKNRKTFDALWHEMERQGPRWLPLEELLAFLLREADSTTLDSPWRLLREIVHWTLKHLCLYVSAEIPLVLYAWQRNLK